VALGALAVLCTRYNGGWLCGLSRGQSGYATLFELLLHLGWGEKEGVTQLKQNLRIKINFPKQKQNYLFKEKEQK